VEIASKQRLLTIISLAVALIVGWQIANESLVLAGLLGSLLLLWLVSQFGRVPADALVAGGVLVGYLVGNRGFAQLHTPQLPLLPAEAALGLGACIAIWRAARSKVLPVQPDALNFLLLVWLAVGAARLRFDFATHGFLAVRDFAMLYYAAFFFLAQGWSADAATRLWVERCLTVGFALTAPVFLVFARWPDFFVAHFTVMGAPLIFVKSDVAGGFMVAGVFWFLARYGRGKRWHWVLLAGINLIGVALSNSRAALVALVVVCVWLAVCRDWRRLRPIGAMAAAALLVLFTAAIVSNKPWTQSPGYRLYESVASIMDYAGSKSYESADLGDKPDNNLFRTTWWRIVVDETWEKGRWLGLGFGYDLADQFTRIYYAEDSEEFTVRSPHNFLLTVFSRMGMVGLALLLALLATMAERTWHAGRDAAQGRTDGRAFSLWLGGWGIFTSACFGVVLEGPMGAVVFWTLLGLANATSAAELEPREAEDAAHPAPTSADSPAAAPLPNAGTAVLLQRAP